MGRLLQGRTPAQLIRIISVANVFIVFSFATMLICARWLPEGHRLSWTAKLILGAIGLTGIIGNLLAESALRKGVAHGQWPEALLAAPRKFVEHPALSFLCWLLVIAAFASFAFPHGPYFWGFSPLLFPQSTFSSVRRALRKPFKPENSRDLLNPAKPLQSES